MLVAGRLLPAQPAARPGARRGRRGLRQARLRLAVASSTSARVYEEPGCCIDAGSTAIAAGAAGRLAEPGLSRHGPDGARHGVALTPSGRAHAPSTRNHRLWEQFLMTTPTCPSTTGAEHVLSPDWWPSSSRLDRPCCRADLVPSGASIRAADAAERSRP